MNKVIPITITLFSMLICVILIASPANASDTPYSSCPDCNSTTSFHPMTAVTPPTKYGDGNILQLMIIYNASPAIDSRLADYNKAVNFETAKPVILGSSDPTTTLQNLIDELEKNRPILQSKEQSIKRYNPDGSLTQDYSNWWMENYVVYRLEADGFRSVLGNMQQGMSFQTAMNQTDQAMLRIINQFSLSTPQINTTIPAPPPEDNTPGGEQSTISVMTDKSNYKKYDTILISGSTKYSASANTLIIDILGNSTRIVSSKSITVSPDGQFSVFFVANGMDWYENGVYTVRVENPTTNQIGKATFYFDSGLSTPQNLLGVTSGSPLQMMSKDGSTLVIVRSTKPTVGQPITIFISFTDSKGSKILHQNYAIVVSQQGKIVLDNETAHTHTGDDVQNSIILNYDMPVDVQITLKGVGLPNTDPATWTGPKGEIISFNTLTGNSFSNQTQITPTNLSGSHVYMVKGSGASAEADCVYANNCFNPNPITVLRGTEVVWTNSDTVGHTVTSGKVTDDDAGSTFDSGIIKAGGEFKFTFNKEGTFDYFCQVHPWMSGKVIVVSGTSLQQPQTESLYTPTQQDIQNINSAKASQTIAGEVNVGPYQSGTTSIDKNVTIQTTNATSDSLDVKVTAPDQTGPKVIMFNLNATTINVSNLKDLGVMYDGKPISPAPNIDAILHAKPTDNPSFAIVVTQNGVQVLVLIPHFSTHTITLTNMSRVVSESPVVPEFGSLASLVLVIAIISIAIVSAKARPFYHKM